MVLPDIVEEIGLRLPAEDLLRCKSVDKSWYSLISSPPFIKSHAKFVSNKEETNKRKIAKITSYKDELEDVYDIPPEWRIYDSWALKGSSNGLVLYTAGLRICVTNPVTREFRELEPLPKLVSGGNGKCFGFGYDSSTDDYKVVMAVYIEGKTLVHVLHLKSNTWKPFGQIKYVFDDMWLYKPGILFNGALHWFWYDYNEKPLIVSFDLAKEEFKEIPQPHDTRYVWNLGCTLGIMDGRLCIFPYFDDDDEEFPSCGTWLIKNYNAKPSWELLSKGSDHMNDHAIHYILNNDTSASRTIPAYSCDQNIQLSRSKDNIMSPIFVQTLVSPFVNNDNNGGPSHAKDNKSTASHTKDNKSTANAGSVKEKREIEEVYSVGAEEKEKADCYPPSGSRVGGLK